MKKKRLLSKINKGLLALALISCFMISGTMAKYTTTVSASDNARVAKFAVKSPMTSEEGIQLFDTLYDTDWREETDVKSKNDDKVIAPGTQGYFDVVIENLSEVSISYDLDVTFINVFSIPIEFSLDQENWTRASAFNPLSANGDMYLGVNDSATVTIFWRWEFERGSTSIGKAANNLADTLLGFDGSANVYVNVKGTFTQID